MTRKKKLLANTTMSICYQLLTLICGFIVPRLFLMAYGSIVNGLVTSITEFLGFISLAECGVGAVVQSAFYKPLAEKNSDEISRIVVSAEKFFRNIAKLLLAYVILLVFIYPRFVSNSFDFIFTASLILVIAISSFAQYYFGMIYRLLLNADQLSFLLLATQGIALVLNVVTSVVLIYLNSPVHLVKLTSSIIFIIQPLAINIYVRKKYNINRRISVVSEPIKQKWNGLAQHVSYVVLNNTDTTVLTLLSTLGNVSVYAVYNLVVSGIKQIIMACTTGSQALFGNMIAKQENDLLRKTFDEFEWVLHTLITLVFSITSVLIVPFVTVYTKGVTDVNYNVPVFAAFITLAQASYCFRLPYNTLVLAAGHYKQTQLSAIIEACINVIVSIILVTKFGLVGVSIGTFLAMAYRTIYLGYYISRNIIKRNIYFFYKHLVIDAICAFTIIIICRMIPSLMDLKYVDYLSWLYMAIKVGTIGVTVVIVINTLTYRKTLLDTLQHIKIRQME